MSILVKYKEILIKFYSIVISLMPRTANIFKLHQGYSNIIILFYPKTNSIYAKSKQLIKPEEDSKTLRPICRPTQVPSKIRIKNQTK